MTMEAPLATQKEHQELPSKGKSFPRVPQHTRSSVAPKGKSILREANQRLAPKNGGCFLKFLLDTKDFLESII